MIEYLRSDKKDSESISHKKGGAGELESPPAIMKKIYQIVLGSFI